MTTTMKEVFELEESKECEDSVVTVIKDDFHSLISRTEELISIVDYNMDQTAERNKAFLRLSLPVMLKQAILDNIADYVKFSSKANSISLSIEDRKEIEAEDLADLITKFFH
jgi:hypothetical protein